MEVKPLILSGMCFFCLAKTNFTWCNDCERDFIPEIERCPVCARNSPRSKVCGVCVTKPPDFDKTEILFNYRYPAKDLIKAFKFNNRPELAKCFAEKLTKKLIEQRSAPLPKIIVPVPLHKKRQRSRGYNQSLEFARQLSIRLRLKMDFLLCNRIKNTDPQSTLPMKTRRKNVKGAFSLNNHYIPKHIAIVDDVITTGATTNEFARLFRTVGCQQIEVWAIART